MSELRTQVAIIGAGPAGLVLAQLLALEGVESVVLERHSRDYVEQRVRAGVLEQGTIDLLRDAGVGERMDREALIHGGIELRFGGRGHRIALSDLTGGSAIAVYGQTEVVKDLIKARTAAGLPLLFDAPAVAVEGIDGERPVVRYEQDGAEHELRCDIVAGCDGFHGVARQAVAAGALDIYEHDYPFAWLGILAAVPPSTEELIYTNHERGFALHSLRSPELSRLYLQCHPDEDIAQWPDERIWAELQARMATDADWTLHEGPILEKNIAPMRSFVASPLRHGRLLLAGDAAHIVPPTGAKGLNLAVNDARLLAEAVAAWKRSGDERLLELYSDTCLRRVWRAEHFSWWMTTMLHIRPGADAFERRLQRSQLDYVASSEAAATTLAENYVGVARA